jgi:Flp pilus assembly protein TadG
MDRVPRRDDSRHAGAMKNAERGSSIVEFAIAASAMLMVIFGIIQCGRALYYYHTVSNAARLGARWAEVRGSRCTAPMDHCNAMAADIQNYISSTVPLLDANNVTVNVTWSTSTDPNVNCSSTSPSGNNDPGHFVCVNVAYRFDLAIPFFSGSPLNLSSTSKEVIAD